MIPIIAALAGQGLGLIGNLITGKGIEYATNFIKDKTGIDIGSITEKPLSNEDALTLRKFQVENELELKKLALEETKSYLADRQNARQREIEVKDKTPARLAYIMIGGFLGISFIQIISISFFPQFASAIPSEGWLLIGNISGYLANEAKQAASYYFGTTSSSSQKNDIIMGMKKG